MESIRGLGPCHMRVRAPDYRGYEAGPNVTETVRDVVAFDMWRDMKLDAVR